MRTYQCAIIIKTLFYKWSLQILKFNSVPLRFMRILFNSYNLILSFSSYLSFIFRLPCCMIFAFSVFFFSFNSSILNCWIIRVVANEEEIEWKIDSNVYTLFIYMCACVKFKNKISLYYSNITELNECSRRKNSQN